MALTPKSLWSRIRLDRGGVRTSALGKSATLGLAVPATNDRLRSVEWELAEETEMR
jgi:hypothetical protein